MDHTVRGARRGRYDIVVPAVSGNAKLLLGSVKWRENKPFRARDLNHLAEGRAVVPGAAGATLPAVCPAGTADDVAVDLALTPKDLLSAWSV